MKNEKRMDVTAACFVAMAWVPSSASQRRGPWKMYRIMAMMLQSHPGATSHCHWVRSHLLPSDVDECGVHVHRPCGGCGPNVEQGLGVHMRNLDLGKVLWVVGVERLVDHHQEGLRHVSATC